MSEQLLNDARIGHRGALNTLLQRYRGALRSSAVRMALEQLGQTVDPTELVRQTLLQAQHAFREFRGSSETEWFEWLQSLLEANIASIASVRSEDTHGPRSADSQFDFFTAPAESPPQGDLERQSQWRQAFESLPSLQQRVVRLRLEQGWSLARISMHLDLEEQRVATSLRTGLRWLRQQLDLDQSSDP